MQNTNTRGKRGMERKDIAARGLCGKSKSEGITDRVVLTVERIKGQVEHPPPPLLP